MAWEAAFVRLASGHLTAMCQAAGLRLSYSAERSVEDELSRESSTDAGTVLLSYLAMLMCATLASCCACQHRTCSPSWTLRLARLSVAASTPMQHIRIIQLACALCVQLHSGRADFAASWRSLAGAAGPKPGRPRHRRRRHRCGQCHSSPW